MKSVVQVLVTVVLLLSLPVVSVAQTTTTLKGHKNTITCLTFSPDGRGR
jgi:hypothetical protein